MREEQRKWPVTGNGSKGFAGDGTVTAHKRRPRGVGRLGGRSEREVREGGDTCLHILYGWDLRCTAETNTTLLSSNPPIKNKLLKKERWK